MAEAEQIAKMFRRAAQFLETEMRAAEKANLTTTLRAAESLSQGAFSLAQLRALGHPYRRGGRPPQDPAIINRQSGIFASSWLLVGPYSFEDGIHAEVVNTSPEAEFLRKGTRAMIERPFEERIREKVSATVERRRLRAIEKALTRAFG